MEVNYQVTITQIGAIAQEALADAMLILFKQGAPSDVADYCFIHSHDDLKQEVKVGDRLQLGEFSYAVTAVGEVASENLRQLGHISLFFDGEENAQFPGAIHLKGEIPINLSVGEQITFFNS